jgi:hypothetical protein
MIQDLIRNGSTLVMRRLQPTNQFTQSEPHALAHRIGHGKTGLLSCAPDFSQQVFGHRQRNRFTLQGGIIHKQDGISSGSVMRKFQLISAIDTPQGQKFEL